MGTAGQKALDDRRSSARAALDAAMTERQLQDQVVAFARLRGWLVYHAFDSRRSQPGFPDICAVRDGRLLFLELKSAKGVVSAEQAEWLGRLEGVEGQVQSRVFEPRQWTEIQELLR